MFTTTKRPTPLATSIAATTRSAISDPPSILSPGLSVVGNLATEGELQVDGVIEGDVVAGKLTVGEKALVKGEITAETLLVRGEVVGSLRARQVQLAASAKVQGDIWHESVSIEAGARVDGVLKHAEYLRRETPKVQGDEAPAPHIALTNQPDLVPAFAKVHELAN